jgi:hypothetical protein
MWHHPGRNGPLLYRVSDAGCLFIPSQPSINSRHGKVIPQSYCFSCYPINLQANLVPPALWLIMLLSPQALLAALQCSLS